MSPADKSGRGSTSAWDSAARSDAAGEQDRSQGSVPPWERATSQVRDEQFSHSSGQLSEDDYAGGRPSEGYSSGGYAAGNGYGHSYDEDEQPTMVQPLASDPDDRLFAPGGGHEGDATQRGGRTPVNLAAEPATRSGSSSSGFGSSAPSALRRPGRGPRRASLQVKRVDPWSVLKLALVLSIAFFLVLMIAVGVLYLVLDGMGVWDKINGTYSDLVSGGGGGGGSGEPLISAGRVLGVSAVVGAVNIVLFTALSTVAAFVYNVSADLAGGLEVTLAERE